MAFVAERCACAGPASLGAVAAAAAPRGHRSVRLCALAVGSSGGRGAVRGVVSLGAGVGDQSNECESSEVFGTRRGDDDRTWVGAHGGLDRGEAVVEPSKEPTMATLQSVFSGSSAASNPAAGSLARGHLSAEKRMRRGSGSLSRC
ncbi:unnamed protein product [Miscanthus lutarioriparius]|uniref:Uncharacterized protein n=1 Tax=Miscanthus lutarioriparius TaxID=422564 RepID=A0A811NVW1_9POAL|nr:unnamed protein product [Miscanthus lutarioriparius]